MDLPLHVLGLNIPFPLVMATARMKSSTLSLSLSPTHKTQKTYNSLSCTTERDKSLEVTQELK